MALPRYFSGDSAPGAALFSRAASHRSVIVRGLRRSALAEKPFKDLRTRNVMQLND